MGQGGDVNEGETIHLSGVNVTYEGVERDRYVCRSCGRTWPEKVYRRWPIAVYFWRPGPAAPPFWTVARWGIEELSSPGRVPPYQRSFSTVVKVGPLFVMFGRGGRGPR